ncbi:MAG: hypothetical protein R3Y38_04470 [Rikenellaceae bacterium]
MKKIFFSLLLSLTMLTQLYSQQVIESKDYTWQKIKAQGEPQVRHENAFVEHKGKFYLLGGRGIMEVNVFDPETSEWSTKGKTPIEFNHFQAVSYGDEIYIVCAMNGRYPVEKPIENVWTYNPEQDKWTKSHAIPKEHQRGGAGTVVYNDKFYVACGIELGHTSGTTNIFSCYDPKTGEWAPLTKAPHVRDHFAAIVHAGKLYCIGGRNSSVHRGGVKKTFFDAVCAQVDVYNFATRKWLTLVNDLPVATAAGGVAVLGENIIYFGGEGSAAMAYNETQCLNTLTGEWTQLEKMPRGLHGSAAIVYKDAIYWAAGSYKKGGSNTGDVYRFGK